MQNIGIKETYILEISEKKILFYGVTIIGTVETIVWEYCFKTNTLRSLFAIEGAYTLQKNPYAKEEGDIVFVGNDNMGTLIGINDFGKIIWNYCAEEIDVKPIFDRIGNYYFVHSKNHLICILKDGRMLWEHRCVGSDGAPIKVECIGIDGEDLHIVGGMERIIYYLNGVKKENLQIQPCDIGVKHIIKGKSIVHFDRTSRCLIYDSQDALWTKEIMKGEILIRFDIVEEDGTVFFLSVRDKEYHFCVLDSEGRIRFERYISKTDIMNLNTHKQIYWIQKRKITILSLDGELEGQQECRGTVIWGGKIGDFIVTIYNTKGMNYFEVCKITGEKVICEKLHYSEECEELDEYLVAVDEMIEDVSNHLVLNYKIWWKYSHVKEIEEIIVTYKLDAEIELVAKLSDGNEVCAMAKAIPPESIQTEDIDLYKECEEFELSTRSLYAYGEKKVEQAIHAITEKTSSYINVMRNLSISELII